MSVTPVFHRSIQSRATPKTMSNDFSQRHDDFSNTQQQQNQHSGLSPQGAVPAYQGDPWAEQQALQDKKKGCGGCAWGCGCGCLTFVLLGIIGCIVFYYSCVKGVPVVVSPETTVITEPLKSDGKTVDFFKAIEEFAVPGVAPEQNGFTEVLRAYGRAMFETDGRMIRAWQFEETCKKLSLDSTEKPSAVFESPKDFLDGNAGNDALDKLASRPWTFEEQPKLKDWLEKVGPGLDIVQQAAMKDHYFMPMVRRNDTELAFLSNSLEALNFQSQLAKALRIRSMQRLGANDPDGAWKDMLAAMRLARFVYAELDFSDFEKDIQAQANRGGEVKPEDLKNALETVFSNKAQTMDAFIKYDGWTIERLNRAIADLETLPSRPDRKTTLKTLQFMLLDLLSSMNNMKALGESIQTDTASASSGSASPTTMFGFNWNVLAKLLNEKFADYEKSISDDDVEKLAEKGLDEIFKQLESDLDKMGKALTGSDVMGMFTVTGRSKLIGKFAGEILPFIEKVVFKEELDEEARSQVLRAALALERYRLEKGEYPENLAENLEGLQLKPLKPVLPIQYEKTEKGYILHSGSLKVEFP